MLLGIICTASFLQQATNSNFSDSPAMSKAEMKTMKEN